MRLFVAAFVLLILPGCVTFSETQRAQIDDARSLMSRAVDDPRFEAVLLAMGANGEIEWEGRLASGLTERPDDPTRWLLDRYAEADAPETEDIRPYVPYLGFGALSSTKASAGYGSRRIRLNVVYLERPTARIVRDPISIANTLVHESAHTFGQTHGGSQRADVNACDAAYVAGALAEALLRSDAAGGAIGEDEVSSPVCTRLAARLRARGVLR